MYVQTKNDALERLRNDITNGEDVYFSRNSEGVNVARVTRDIGEALVEAYDDMSVYKREGETDSERENED